MRNGESTAVNIKEGFDNQEGVSARAKGFALMIEKFVDRVRNNPLSRIFCLKYRTAAT